MILILIVFIGLLQAADTWTTLTILGNGGTEKNPIMRWLMGVFGQIPALIGTKSVLMVALVIADLPIWAYLLIAALYTWVVCHNLLEMRK